MSGQPETIINHKQDDRTQKEQDCHTKHRREPSHILSVIVDHVLSDRIGKTDQITPCFSGALIVIHKNSISLFISTGRKREQFRCSIADRIPLRLIVAENLLSRFVNDLKPQPVFIQVFQPYLFYADITVVIRHP